MATFAGAPVFGSYFLNAQGKPHRSVLITVYEAGTNTKPDLFTDRAKTEPLSNPFNADSLGNVDFLVDGVGEFEALVNGVRVPFTVLPDGLEPVDLDRVTGLTAALAARALDVDLDTEVAARTAAVAAEASARAAAVTAEASARAAADSTLTSNVATNTSAIATNTSAIAGKQPLDSDLTAIAALSTTSFGRNLLALADGAALAGAIPSGTYAPLVTGVVPLVNLPVGADDLAVGLVGMSLLDPTDGLVLDVETHWGIDPVDGPYWEEDPADVVPGEDALFRIEEDGTMSWLLMSEVR